LWAEELRSGSDILTPFLDTIVRTIEIMIERELIEPKTTALIGLSRGVLFAAHVAARIASLKMLLGFAPLTKLSLTKEFLDLKDNDLVCSMDLEKQIPALINKKIRFYVSNRDTRISTKECFELIHNLAIASQEKGIRSPELDLIIKPPIGMHGHGTSKETFTEGAQWLLNMWGLPS
jgi:esterase FrsA